MVVFLLCLLIGGPSFAQADKLEGVWSVTETILSACPTGDPVRTFPDMNVFIRAGTMVEASATLGIGAPPLVRLNPGLGTCDHIAARHFTEHFTFFRYDPGTDAFAGVQVINKHIVLSKDGNAFASTGTADIFDANGNPIATRCTMATAVRIN
jgi:hypothetical protein